MRDIVEALERDPLRNIVLLKHLEAFPGHTRVHRFSGPAGTATLVLLDAAASAWDRRTYPTAEVVALIASDHPDLTRALLAFVPRGVGVVFKLSGAADHDVVAAAFPVERTTSVLSFTARSRFGRDEAVRVTMEPDDAVFALFESQDHSRDWLAPLLASNRAFASVLERDSESRSVCFAFENYRRVWEVGGLVTPPAQRGRGFAARVVRTALAELGERRLIARYQAHDDNVALIGLARSIGLDLFLTITHFLTPPCASG